MDDLLFSSIRVILVLAGLLAVVFVLRKYAGRFKMPLTQKRTEYGVSKVDTLHLGYKKYISVVEVKNRVFVVGVGEKELSLLGTFEKEEKPS